MRPYPRGDAFAIAQARQRGQRPAEVVTVVLAGRHRFASPTVYADARRPYRWDWLADLPVVVLTDRTTDLGTALADIHAVRPSQLDVIDAERCLGWLILSVYPLQTVRWPRAWVQDWLGDGSLFCELDALKAQAVARLAGEVAKRTRGDAEYAGHEFEFGEPLRKAA